MRWLLEAPRRFAAAASSHLTSTGPPPFDSPQPHCKTPEKIQANYNHLKSIITPSSSLFLISFSGFTRMKLLMSLICGDVVNLRNLYLQDNLFSGPIPDSFSPLVNLVRVSFENQIGIPNLIPIQFPIPIPDTDMLHNSRPRHQYNI